MRPATRWVASRRVSRSCSAASTRPHTPRTSIWAILSVKMNKATYTPNVDMGDFVIVLNAGGVRLTGTKPDKKLYQHHTLFPGGIRTRVAKEVIANNPEHAIREAVWGMMPKGPLGRRI